MNIHSKRCTKCMTCKPVAEYHANSFASDGLEHRCKACRSSAKAGTGRQSQWSEAEIGVLRAFYPAGGADACEVALDGRSKNAIQRQACKLKIACEAVVTPRHAPEVVAPATPIPTHDHHADAFREWQAIDRKIAAIPAANGPTFCMGWVA